MTYPAWGELYPESLPVVPSAESKPCRPIYCAKHYDGVQDEPCSGAYKCPDQGEES